MSQVSSQRSSVTGRNDCTGGLGNPMCHVSSVPSTWCGLPPGLVDRNFLVDRRWSGRQLVTELSNRSGTFFKCAKQRSTWSKTPKSTMPKSASSWFTTPIRVHQTAEEPSFSWQCSSSFCIQRTCTRDSCWSGNRRILSHPSCHFSHVDRS